MINQNHALQSSISDSLPMPRPEIPLVGMAADMAAIADSQSNRHRQLVPLNRRQHSYISLDSHQTTPVTHLSSESQIRGL
jgi:hypothetical protein